MISDKEIKLEILRAVLESGSELTKSNPLPKCDEYYTWVCKANESSPYKSKTIRKNLTDKKE